jgi:hypothetical protein
MHISRLILIVGVITFIFGIVLAVAAPPSTTWEPKSYVLASERPLTVSAKWQTKSWVLADEESISVSPSWVSQTGALTDVSMEVSSFRTYAFWSAFADIYEEAKDIVVVGHATEQSTPQVHFNLYILDGENFDLWEAGETYTSYYEARNIISASFDLSFETKDELPNTFYFVIEELEGEPKPTVHVKASVDWVERKRRYEYIDYYSFLEGKNVTRLVAEDKIYITLEAGEQTTHIVIGEARDFLVEGAAEERTGNLFNFYLMDWTSYHNFTSYNWYEKTYTPYYEAKDISTITFSVPFPREKAFSGIHFVVENLEIDIDSVVGLSATLSWVEKASIDDYSNFFDTSGVGLEFGEVRDIVLRVEAQEMDSNQFNFYVFDSTNYFNWKDDRDYAPYYEEMNISTTSFDIPLTLEQADTPIYFTVENPLKDIQETVHVSASLEWDEKVTSGLAIGGSSAGGVVAFIGLVVMIAGGIATLVLKRKTTE